MKKIFTLTLLFSSSLALGWGKVGHEATAIIASNNLSEVAKEKIRLLIGTTDLRESSVWPDAMRSQSNWQHTKAFHFTGVQDNSSYLESLRHASQDELVKGDALRALVKAEDELRDPKVSSELKINALKFLVHFLGDIHQPLHTGRPEDLGGNQLTVQWNGKKSNLHSVWDTGIITMKLEEYSDYRPELAENSEYYVSKLRPAARDVVDSWSRGSFLQWHDEAYALRPKSYLSVRMLNHEVVKQFKDTVDEQVHKAGIRIAHVLNSIFEGKSLSIEGINLRKHLSSLVGTNPRDIVLAPMSRNRSKSLESEYPDICDHH